MINKRRLIKTFKKLVQTDSPSLKEGKLVAFLQKELKFLGHKASIVGRPAEGEVGSLIVNISGKGPQVLLNSHIDTVAHHKPIKPIKRRGFLVSGSGTILGADDKAGVAAILEILKILKEKKLPHPPLQIVFTVAEEIGLVGAKLLPKRYLKADFGLVVDGGDINEIVYKAPSQKNITATIIGKAAHAGIHPEDGINAIKVAAEAIDKMNIGRIDKETTANIGTIEGGRATNIIPDRVQLKGEARSHSPKKLKKQINYMKKVIERACRKHKAKSKVVIKDVYPSFEVKRSAKVLKLAVAQVKKAKIKPVVKMTGGGSDANIFNAAGIPCVIMGVGADHVHTSAERLPIKDFVKGTEIILGLIVGMSS